MRCGWCNQPAGSTYHPECWRQRNEASNRELEALMYEAHDAIAALKRGETVNVSAACIERYGENIAYWRKAQQ